MTTIAGGAGGDGGIGHANGGAVVVVQAVTELSSQMAAFSPISARSPAATAAKVAT